MRKLRCKTIAGAVRDACISLNCRLTDDALKAFRKSLRSEKKSVAREILNQIIKNNRIAQRERLAICQDTGVVVVFVEYGSELSITGGNIYKAINDGVKAGYREGFFRNSIVKDPLRRVIKGENIPAIIHTEFIKGSGLKLTLLVKGGGSENYSTMKMFNPTSPVEEIEKFLVGWIKYAGSKPCPPVIIGMGIGGNFEYSALLSKKALLRKIGSKNRDPYYQKLEQKFQNAINRTGIGPGGLGGKTTALAVFIEHSPCHIASLPVAISINCCAVRHKAISL